MVSREGSEQRMPSLPMAMPSVTVMVLNSTGVPPAARMPALACSASARRLRLHGETSDQLCTTATSGLAMAASRSEEHTSELQSLMRISYAVFCLNKHTTPHL